MLIYSAHCYNNICKGETLVSFTSLKELSFPYNYAYDLPVATYFKAQNCSATKTLWYTYSIVRRVSNLK